MDEKTPAELYEMIGDTFRLPVMVQLGRHREWSPDCVRVALAQMPWLTIQRSLMESALGKLCYRKDREHGWILTRETLDQYFQKSKESEPENVVVWNWTEPPDEKDTSGFIESYCLSRDAVISDRGHASIVWSSFLKFAISWMLDRNRKLDLGFATVSALPVRGNWIEILDRRYKEARVYIAFRDTEFVNRYMSSKCVTAIDDGGLLRWSMAIEPTEKFNNAAERVERARRKECAASYPHRVRKLLNSKTHRLHEIFKAYLAEAALETFKLPPRSSSRAQSNWRNSRWSRAKMETQNANGLERGDDSAQILAACDPADVARENASVSEVSDLQSSGQDLRNVGRKMGEASDDDRGGAGLHVLHANEGKDAGQLLSL